MRSQVLVSRPEHSELISSRASHCSAGITRHNSWHPNLTANYPILLQAMDSLQPYRTASYLVQCAKQTMLKSKFKQMHAGVGMADRNDTTVEDYVPLFFSSLLINWGTDFHPASTLI